MKLLVHAHPYMLNSSKITSAFCYLLSFAVSSNFTLHCSSFIEEANIMNVASSQFVLRVYGIFEGCLPFGRMPIQKGIVMEFMPRGSVQSLQNDWSGPPPWPLAFRLAHEVALGVNFLHSKNLMHSDLKPSNVLLDDDLHAKVECHKPKLVTLHRI